MTRSRPARRSGALFLALMLACLVAASPTAASGRDVLVSEATGDGRDHCPFVSLRDLPISGGCVVEDSMPRMRLTVVTPFASLPFVTCRLDYAVHIDPTGEVWIHDAHTVGDNPCADVRACFLDGVSIDRPWKGIVHRDGRGLHVHLDVCFDTCMGWFEGSLKLDLERVSGGWHARAEDAPIGETGLEIDGDWRLGRRDLRIRVAPDRY